MVSGNVHVQERERRGSVKDNVVGMYEFQFPLSKSTKSDRLSISDDDVLVERRMTQEREPTTCIVRLIGNLIILRRADHKELARYTF